jgi:hypothetical protein
VAERLWTFAHDELTQIPSKELTAIRLLGHEPEPGVTADGADLVFESRGWYEVLLTVCWSTDNTTGTRFSHTAIPDAHPLHSEAINAKVLADLSNGRQLLRGNSIFNPDGPNRIRLEVWHDAEKAIDITRAELAIRKLDGQPGT